MNGGHQLLCWRHWGAGLGHADFQQVFHCNICWPQHSNGSTVTNSFHSTWSSGISSLKLLVIGRWHRSLEVAHKCLQKLKWPCKWHRLAGQTLWWTGCCVQKVALWPVNEALELRRLLWICLLIYWKIYMCVALLGFLNAGNFYFYVWGSVEDWQDMSISKAWTSVWYRLIKNSFLFFQNQLERERSWEREISMAIPGKVKVRIQELHLISPTWAEGA